MRQSFAALTCSSPLAYWTKSGRNKCEEVKLCPRGSKRNCAHPELHAHYKEYTRGQLSTKFGLIKTEAAAVRRALLYF